MSVKETEALANFFKDEKDDKVLNIIILDPLLIFFGR